MRFRRINDKTIRCIVSREDMQEYGIALEDFFKNKSKIHDFLHVVVERAEEEVGYEPREGMLSMQIMPISPNSISITFTEGDEEERADMLMQSIKDTIQGMLDAEIGDGDSDSLDDDSYEAYDMDDEDDYPEDLDAEDFEPLSFNSDQEVAYDERHGQFHGKAKEKQFPLYQKMVLFLDSLEVMSAYCKAADVDKTVKSDLYYLPNRNLYGLMIEKGRLSNNVFRHMIMLAVEFGGHVSDSELLMSYVSEHGELLVEKKAYRILRKNY